MSEYGPVISGGFGLLGVVVGSLSAWYSGRKQQKTASTFLLHHEFCGKEMNDVRYRAGSLIKEYPTGTLQDIYDKYPIEKTTPLWTLMEFYLRLWVSLKNKQLKDSLVPELFGSIFVWWNVNCFDERLKGVDWDEKEYLHQFGKWLEKNAKNEDFTRWNARAERHRARTTPSQGQQLAQSP